MTSASIVVTSLERHKIKEKLVQQLAQEICSDCARYSPLYEPKGPGTGNACYNYTHATEKICAASQIYVAAVACNITVPANPPDKRKP